MGKNIRLNESQFNELITESVNRILTELDWRTYASAAKKRDAQMWQHPEGALNARDKGGKRLNKLVHDLSDAASEALTSKYKRRYDGEPRNNADVWTRQGYQVINTNNFDGKGGWSNGRFNYLKNGWMERYGNINSPMDDEVEDYLNGKSKYVKGKGWQ